MAMCIVAKLGDAVDFTLLMIIDACQLQTY